MSNTIYGEINGSDYNNLRHITTSGFLNTLNNLRNSITLVGSGGTTIWVDGQTIQVNAGGTTLATVQADLYTSGYIRNVDFVSSGFIKKSEVAASGFMTRTELVTSGYTTIGEVRTDIRTSGYELHSDILTSGYLKRSDLIGSGYVTSVNGVKNAVTITGSGGVTVWADGQTVQVASSSSAGNATPSGAYTILAFRHNNGNAGLTNNFFIAGPITNATALSSRQFTRNTYYLTPFIVTSGCQITEFAFNITIGGATGSTVEIGLYANTECNTLYPSGLLWDSKQITVNTNTGVTSTGISPTIALEPGKLYWTCFCVTSSAAGEPTISAIPVAAMYSIYGQTTNAFGALGLGLTLGGVGTANGFPDPFPDVATSGTAYATLFAMPAIRLTLANLY